MTNISKHTITRIAVTATFLLVALGACNNNNTPDETVGTTDPAETSPSEQPQAHEPMPGDQTAPGEAPRDPTAQDQTATEDVSDEDLDQFAAAYSAVQAMAPQYEERLMNATPEEANEIQREATEAVRQEVEKHGITFERFTEIAVNLETSPELQQRLTQKLQNQNGRQEAARRLEDR
jgi:hypothetical protein